MITVTASTEAHEMGKMLKYILERQRWGGNKYTMQLLQKGKQLVEKRPNNL